MYTATVAPVTNGAMPTGAGSWVVTGVTGVTTCSSTTGPITTTLVTYTCTVTATKAGTYGVTFTYNGDTNYSQTIVSASQTVSVAKVTPTVAVTANATTANLADLITFTAVVNGATGATVPSGNGTWTITGVSGLTTCSSTTGPTAGVNLSTYTCSLLATKAGTYGATFSVGADTSYNAVSNTVSSSSTVVSQYTPTVLVTASAPTANLGSSFTFTATLQGPNNGPAPTGTGSWNITGVTGVTCASQTGPNGASSTVTYTCTVTATSAGIYVPLFTYNGDSNYAATSPTSGYTTTVAKATPTVSASANASSAALGSTITFTATVAGPTGAVAPTAAGVWSIIGVSGVTSCSTTTGPVPASNVSTYTCSVVASVAGTYQATFTFPGDSAYYSVAPVTTSNSTVVAVATPTILLGETGSTTLGGSLLFTAIVTGSSNASAPTGSMNWAISGTAGITSCSNTTGPVTAGITATYTCTVQTPYAGSYIVQANFVGSASYASISSSALTFTVTQQNPTITLVASANPTLNGTTTLTTTVSGVTNAVLPSGAVSWTLTDPHGNPITCGNVTGPVTQSGVETYTCNFVTSQSGTYHATSTIAADGNYLAATSSIVSVNVLTATPTIFVSYSPSNPTVGQPLTVTALVTGQSGSGAPSGTLTWTISGEATSCTSNPATTYGSITALFTCDIATPVAGTYSVVATYNGDATYASLPPTTEQDIAVGKGTPTIAVTSSPSSPVLAGTITFTATITNSVSGAATPYGSVTWTVSGQATTCGSTTGPVANGNPNQSQFTCSITASTAGTYTVTATYSGDSNYTSLAATSPTSVSIAKVSPTIALTGSTTGLINSTLVFTATVTGSTGALAPTGTMSWNVSGTGGATSCTSTPAPSISGVITTYICNITATGYGSYIVTASYPGDSNYLAATSNSFTLGVGQSSDTVTVSASPSPTLGGSTVLTAVVTGPTNGSQPAGIMGWTITNPASSTIICSSSTNATAINAYTSSYTCTIPTTTAGTYLVQANFPGDVNYKPGNSSTINVVVPQNTPSLTVTGVQSNGTGGQIITYTATILGTFGSLAPTGNPTWIFTGPSNSCSATTGPVTSGVSTIYTCVVPATSAGTYSASITYPGDSNYTSAGPSTPYVVNVSKFVPAIAVTTSSPTATLGSSFTFTATVTGPVSGATPTGTASWIIAGVSGVSCSSTTGPTGVSNVATYTCSVVASSAGTYIPLFTFNGDSNYLAQSPTSGYTTSVTTTSPTITVNANSSTAVLGSTITFTATVAGPSGVSAPTGTGTWSITGVTGVTACASTTGPSSVSNVSTYTCSLLVPVTGTYGATFNYGGDGAYNAVSNVASLTSTTVSAYTPTILVIASGSPTLGGTITFTATVTGATGSATPTGTLNWSISGTGGSTSCISSTGPTASGNVATYSCTIQTNNVGTYISQATYVGDTNYNTVTSTPITLTIDKQTPTITLSQSPHPTLGGNSILTTTVTGVVNATAPTGAVSWTITDPNGASTNCTNPTGPSTLFNVETYTCTLATTIAGIYHATTTIGSDANYVSATSTAIAINLTVATPSIYVSASPTTPTVGQPITFSALVTGIDGEGAPTGTLTWSITGAASVCTSTTGPTEGTLSTLYTCVVNTPASGTYTATATYNGDGTYAALPATSPVSITVGTSSPTISVGVTPSSPNLGDTITFTATVTGVTGATAPTGTITWGLTGPASSCTTQTGPLTGTGSNQTIWTCAFTATSAGTYAATATYGGDSNYAALPTTSPVSVTVGKISPFGNIVLTGSGSGSVGSNLTFTATVTGSGGVAPTGATTWTVTGSAGITSCTSNPTTVSSGSVTTYYCDITASYYGTYTVTANYPGDSNYLPGTSNSVTLGISNLLPTVTLSSPSTPVLGGTTTLNATVSGVSPHVPGGVMAWTVTNSTGASVTCTNTTPGFTVSDPTSQTAYSCTFPNVTAGNYTATANFPGDANYELANSNTITISVPKATPALSIVASQSVTGSGQSITFTASITGSTGSVAPTGAPLWSLTGGPSSCASTTGPVLSSVTAIYTCTIPAVLAGTYTAAITYPGDTNYLSVGPSSPYGIVISKVTPTVTVTTSSATALLGSTFTFTAVVAGPTGGVAPTGTATWSITGVSGISCNSYTGPVASSNTATYTCSVIATSAGIYVPLFTYNGDSNYFASALTSGYTTTVSKTTPAVAVTANSGTATLGSTVTFTATVTGPSGANSPVGVGVWAVTGVPAVTTCATTTGPIAASNVSTYTCSFVASVAGTYSATFAFPGDSAYYAVAAVSSSNSTAVAAATPTISVASSGTPTLGGTVTFTATVTGSANAVAPTGTVTWTITGTGGANSCSSTNGPTSAGIVSTYTCTVVTANAGTYVAQAVYDGDSNYVTVTSSATTFTLAKQLPVITVVASSNPTLGGTTTLTTTVYGIANALVPTGAVSWSITDPNNQPVSCTNPTGPSTVTNVSTYTCQFTTAIVGQYSITSTIAGDTNYLAATSSPITLTLGVYTPTIYVSASPSNPTVGQPITFTALITGSNTLAAPTGTVTWTITGAASSCSTTTNPSSAPHTSAYGCVIDTPVVGTYTAVATYNGDVNYSSLPATTATSVTVTQATPTIAVTSSPSNPIFGGTITFTATVTGISGATAPGGTLTWSISGATSSCVSNTGPVAGGSSTQTIFTCVVNASPAGTYSAVATYNGDSNYTSLAPTSAISVTIAKASPAIVLTGTGSGTLNSTLVFTATVTGTTGATAPTGTITWTVGGSANITSCTTTPAPTSLGSVTTYQCDITAANYGSYTVSAQYNGDTNYLSENSNSVTLGISQVVPTVTLTESGTPTLGGSITLTAEVTGPANGATPGGVMAWTVTNALGASITCTTTTPTNTPANPLISTDYSCIFPTATAGNYSAQANFPGDANYE